MKLILDVAALVLAFALDSSLDLAAWDLAASDLADLDLALIFIAWRAALLLLLLLLPGCGFRWPQLDLAALDLALIFMGWRVELLLLLAACTIRLSLQLAGLFLTLRLRLSSCNTFQNQPNQKTPNRNTL